MEYWNAFRDLFHLAERLWVSPCFCLESKKSNPYHSNVRRLESTLAASSFLQPTKRRHFRSSSLHLKVVTALDHFLLPQMYCFIYCEHKNWTLLLLTHKAIKNKVFSKGLKTIYLSETFLWTRNKWLSSLGEAEKGRRKPKLLSVATCFLKSQFRT
jgi:hypothetical protein